MNQLKIPRLGHGFDWTNFRGNPIRRFFTHGWLKFWPNITGLPLNFRKKFKAIQGHFLKICDRPREKGGCDRDNLIAIILARSLSAQ